MIDRGSHHQHIPPCSARTLGAVAPDNADEKLSIPMLCTLLFDVVLRGNDD
jgi:hypothetical protein